MEVQGYLIVVAQAESAEEALHEEVLILKEAIIQYGHLEEAPQIALEMITNKETDSKKKKNTKRKTMTFLFGVGEKNKTKTKMKKAILLILFVSTSAIAQVGINTSTPDASAALDVESTTGGLLIPRMTQAQRDAIASPSNGLMIYQTDLDAAFYFYNGSAWSRVDGVAERGIDSNISDVVLLQNTQTYTVPSGKSARISSVLSSVIPNVERIIVINSTNVYVGGSNFETAGQNDGMLKWTHFTINGDYWLPEGTTVSVSSTSSISFLSIQEVNSSLVNAKLITSSVTVPAGKKWKISSVMPSVSIVGDTNFLIDINGSSISIGYAYRNRRNSGSIGGDAYSMIDGEIWLPEGTTLSPSSNIYGISLIEY